MPPSSNTTHQHAIIQKQLNPQGYQVLSLLGKGGSGSVWLAKDARLKRNVAIKLLHTDSATQNQMVQEARLLAKCNHPGVVQIYDIVTLQDQHSPEQFAIVMEFIEGSSLLAWQQETLPDTHSKLAVLLQLAQTLSYIHQQDIVHGDIKPANILMRGSQPVITDFGEALAKINIALQKAEHEKAGQQAIRSTQSWSAPEVQTRRSISPASDAYSFALVALWLLSHWHPCEAQPGFNLEAQQHQQFLQQFDSVSQSLPQGMGLLLRKLLHWQPESRQSDFSIITLELQQIVRLNQQQTPLNQDTVLLDDAAASETVSLSSVSASSPQNRHKKRFWLAGFALLVLLATGAGFLLLNKPPQTRFIALLPPDVTGSLDANREQLLASAVSHAIENNIINNKHFLLIPSADIRGVIRQAKEQEDGPLNLTQIVGNAMGATDVISIALDCAITHCDVSLSRSEKPSHVHDNGTAKWTTSLSDRFSTPLLNSLRFSDLVAQRFPSLFELSDQNIDRIGLISENAFDRYLEIYTEFRNSEGSKGMKVLSDEIETLIDAYPDFHSWYWLYREISLKAFHYSEDKDFLIRISKTLSNAPEKYKESINYIIDEFWMSLAQNSFETALGYLELLEQRRLPIEQVLYYRAILSFEKHEFEKSISLLEELRQYHNSSNVLHNLALSYWYLGDVINSIAVLEKAITLNPTRIDLKQLLGSALLVAGKLERSASVYESLLELTENSSDLSNLSIVKTLQGNYQDALQYAERAVFLSPENPSWHLNLADALNLTGRHSEATSHYKKTLELISDTSEFHNRLIMSQALSHLGKIEDAINQIESIKEDYKENEYVLFTAALVYAVLERPALSMFHINKSIELGFNVIWYTLPWFSFLCSQDEVKEISEPNLQKEVCSTSRRSTDR